MKNRRCGMTWWIVPWSVLNVIRHTEHHQNNGNQSERHRNDNNRKLRLLFDVVHVDGELFSDLRHLVPDDDQQRIRFRLVKVMSNVEFAGYQWQPFGARFISRHIVRPRLDLYAIIVGWRTGTFDLQIKYFTGLQPVAARKADIERIWKEIFSVRLDSADSFDLTYSSLWHRDRNNRKPS